MLSIHFRHPTVGTHVASTVNQAFDEFLREKVRLDRQISARARDSRSWLIQQLHSLADGSTDLPNPYEEMTYPYGSFARRTKIRELDDIDLILALKAQGSTYSQAGSKITLNVPDSAPFLRALCNDGTDVLNSKKVINRIIKELARVPQYKRSDMKRNGSAAVLDLSSYSWVFDIVPAFFTTQESDGRQYYLIPDGDGSWMKTDPRIDQENITSTNQNHNGNLLDLIRIVKYWNRRATMPTIGSYLLECMVVNFSKQRLIPLSEYPDVNIAPCLSYVAGAIYNPVQDPKGIDGNINNVELLDAMKIAQVARRDVTVIEEARAAESRHDHRTAISKWRAVFGDEFPVYS